MLFRVRIVAAPALPFTPSLADQWSICIAPQECAPCKWMFFFCFLFCNGKAQEWRQGLVSEAAVWLPEERKQESDPVCSGNSYKQAQLWVCVGIWYSRSDLCVCQKPCQHRGRAFIEILHIVSVCSLALLFDWMGFAGCRSITRALVHTSHQRADPVSGQLYTHVCFSSLESKLRRFLAAIFAVQCLLLLD